MNDKATNPLVEVLLATHNGAAYLPEQIASVLQQDHSNLRILARDDGSTDATTQVLDEAQSEQPERFRIVASTAPTGSAAGNFRELLLASSGEYVAFCDQDDVWLPTKLTASLRQMRTLEQQHGSTVPLLVFSDLKVVDASLAQVSASLWRNNDINPSQVCCLPRLLGENVVTGCTVLMNRPMTDLASRMPAPRESDGKVPMHDHWVALLAATMGYAAWIDTPTVLYRQHGSNVVGAAHEDKSFFGKLRRLFGVDARAKRRYSSMELQQQAALFLDSYGSELTAEDRVTLSIYSTLGQQGRMRQLFYLCRYGLWRGTPERNLTTLFDLFRG